MRLRLPLEVFLLAASIAAADGQSPLGRNSLLGGKQLSPAIVKSTRVVASLNLRQAILLSLRNNLELRSEGIGPHISEADIEAARAPYDPVLFLNTSESKTVSQSTSALSGAARLRSRADHVDFGIRRTLHTGTTLTLEMDLDRTSSNSTFLTLDPVWKSKAGFSISQSLLRGFGFEFNRANILIARDNRDISYQKFRQKLVELVTDVEKAYWDLVNAREQFNLQKASLDLARELLAITQQRRKAGDLTLIDVLEAESNVAAAEEAVIRARNAIGDAEDVLKSKIRPSDMDYLFNVQIQPVEPLPLDDKQVARPRLELIRSINRALGERPELIQTRLGISAKKTEILAARNQMLPKVDLSASLFSTGTDKTSNSSLKFLRTGDFYEYSLALAVEFPFGNRSARAAYRKAVLQKRQLGVNLKALEKDVIHEVRRVARAVETAVERINATKKARSFAQRKWDAEKLRLKLGDTTVFKVDEFRKDLTEARTKEILAIIDFFKARADYRKAVSSTLDGLERYLK